MRRIAQAGALVSVLAVLSGCWAFGPLTREEGEPSPVARPMMLTFGPSPVATAWAAQSVVIVQLGDAGGASLTADQIAASAAVIEARLAALGVAASVTAIPDDRLRIELADPASREAVGRVATAPGDLEFVPVPDAFADSIVEGAALPAGMPVDPLFGGDSITTLELGADQMDQPAIDIQFDAEAAEVFDDWAADHIGSRFAMVLDGLVISAPVIRAADFNGRAQISGGPDLQGTQELVAIVSGGALPVPAAVLTVCPATTGDCALSSPSPSGPPGG